MQLLSRADPTCDPSLVGFPESRAETGDVPCDLWDLGVKRGPMRGCSSGSLWDIPGSAQEPWEHLELFKEQSRVCQGCPMGLVCLKSLNPAKEKGKRRRGTKGSPKEPGLGLQEGGRSQVSPGQSPQLLEELLPTWGSWGLHTQTMESEGVSRAVSRSLGSFQPRNAQDSVFGGLNVPFCRGSGRQEPVLESWTSSLPPALDFSAAFCALPWDLSARGWVIIVIPAARVP